MITPSSSVQGSFGDFGRHIVDLFVTWKNCKLPIYVSSSTPCCMDGGCLSRSMGLLGGMFLPSIHTDQLGVTVDQTDYDPSGLNVATQRLVSRPLIPASLGSPWSKISSGPEYNQSSFLEVAQWFFCKVCLSAKVTEETVCAPTVPPRLHLNPNNIGCMKMISRNTIFFFFFFFWLRAVINVKLTEEQWGQSTRGVEHWCFDVL